MKNLLKTSPKQVLGVMVDGRDLKIAHLGKQGSEISIFALESLTLQRRLGKISTHRVSTPVTQESEGKDLFGLEEPEPLPDGFNAIESEEGDVSSALINIFSKYPLTKAGLAINIPEGHAIYYNFENDFGLKRDVKLRKRLRAELAPLAGVSLDVATLDYFRLEGGELTAIVSEGNLPLVEELQEIKNFLPRNTPFYSLIGTNEIALVNLARINFDLPSTKITAIIFIGCDFSRVIILRGAEPISFVQSVREGYQSPQICQTLFSKILLEQEEAGLPEIDQIILTGEIGITHAHEFFTKQFPEAKVQSITPGPLNTQYLKAEEIAIFPNFAIPVALAWEALDPKYPSFIRTNLTPTTIREAQKFFKIAWHGFAMLGLVFSGMALLTYQGISRWNTIKSLENSIRHKQESAEVLQPQIAMVNQMQNQIGGYRANLDFLDSLIVDPGKWSRLFGTLSTNFETVNKIWVEDIKSDPQGFTMVGKALQRDRIPDLAAGFDSTDLRRVTRVISEAGEVTYEFELVANLPAPTAEDFAEPIPMGTAEPLAEENGSVSEETEAQNEGGLLTENATPTVADEEQSPPTGEVMPPAPEGQSETPLTSSEVMLAPVDPTASQNDAILDPGTEQIVGVTMYSEPAGPPLPLNPETLNSSSLPTTEPITNADQRLSENTPASSEIAPEPTVAISEELPAEEPAQIIGMTMYSEPAGPPLPPTPAIAPTPDTDTPIPQTLSADNPVPEPASATDLYDIGIRLIREGEGLRALKLFKSFIATYPQAKELAAAQYWLGECYYQEKQYALAAQHFQASLAYRRHTKRAAGLLMLGQTYLKLGRTEEARAQLKTLLQEFPGSEFAVKARQRYHSLLN